MVTTCFICGLKISNAEGWMLSYLNVGNGDNNKAAYTCKTYHTKLKEKQTKRDVERTFLLNKIFELTRRIETLERNSSPIGNIFDQMGKQQLPPSIPSTFIFNKNGHLEGCLCIRCSDLK